MQYSRIVLKKEINESLNSLLLTIGKKNLSLKTIRGQGSNFYISERIYSFLKEIYAKSSGLNSMLAGILLEHVHELEKVSPGSGKFMLCLIRDKFNDLNFDYDSFSDVKSRDLRKHDIDKILNVIGASAETASIVKEAIELAGMTGKIFIDRSNKNETVIELKNGYNFSLILPIGPFFNENKWEKNWCKCLLIDGVVETLGEIDGILQEAGSQKLPLAIFARGFSSDVINTLKVNFDRRTLDILPISFGVDDIKTVNSIADVARIIGSDVVTPLKGDIISAASLDDTKAVQKIICHNGTVTIINEHTAADVKLHTNELRKKAAASHTEISKLINERIRTLSSKCVIINFGGRSISEVDILMDEADLGLKMIQSAIQWGVTDTFDLNDTAATYIDSSHSDVILSTTLPAIGAFVKKFLKNIEKIDVAIIND